MADARTSRMALSEAAQGLVLDDEPVGAACLAPAKPSELLTAAQLAERWQIPVRTIYAWARRNAIPHYRAGRLLRFDPDEVAYHFRQVGFAVDLVGDPDRPGESAFELLSA